MLRKARVRAVHSYVPRSVTVEAPSRELHAPRPAPPDPLRASSLLRWVERRRLVLRAELIQPAALQAIREAVLLRQSEDRLTAPGLQQLRENRLAVQVRVDRVPDGRVPHPEVSLVQLERRRKRGLPQARGDGLALVGPLLRRGVGQGDGDLAAGEVAPLVVVHNLCKRYAVHRGDEAHAALGDGPRSLNLQEKGADARVLS